MAKQYKYSLMSGSKKFFCPNCKKKTFVPYVVTGTNNIVDSTKYGRCDRWKDRKVEDNKKINYIMLCILNNYTYIYKAVARLTLATKRILSLVRRVLKSDAIFFFRGFTFYMYYEQNMWNLQDNFSNREGLYWAKR